MLRVTSDDTAPWVGPVSEFLESQPELSEFVRRRIEGLKKDESLVLDFPTLFTVKRIS